MNGQGRMISVDALLQALSAAGMDLSGGGAGGMGGGGCMGSYSGQMGMDDPAEDDELVSWNNTDVKVPPPNRPKFFDKAQTEERPARQAMQRPRVPYLQPQMEEDPDMAPFAAAMS
jgi:hypothetical protein